MALFRRFLYSKRPTYAHTITYAKDSNILHIQISFDCLQAIQQIGALTRVDHRIQLLIRAIDSLLCNFHCCSLLFWYPIFTQKKNKKFCYHHLYLSLFSSLRVNPGKSISIFSIKSFSRKQSLFVIGISRVC